ncbi:Phosphate import ATP-binding protein PstB 2 [Smittium mucronatum]|uniref:Phosphate import ATP-binding protein PstB 2 n=1 Tax=Smittium mucronatum TaxID=133383 RepID=A0A1R0H8I2_9FUNG|nr:Phosphate import ATP-binding protein PstB 2 [Smittium mucronatum]
MSNSNIINTVSSEATIRIDVHRDANVPDAIPKVNSPLLIVENLCKRLENGKSVLNDLTFSLNRGQIIAVRGGSGVGKTTLLKCISQLSDYDSGSMTLFDEDGIISPETNGISYWRSQVMYVPQRMPLLDGTPLEFHEKISKFFYQKSKPTSNPLAGQIEEPVRIAHEWGIESQKWSQKWSQLSGGEMQRISLAISLSCHPKVLLLDEPTSALDNHSSMLVEKTLMERRNIIIITHNNDQSGRVSDFILELHPFGNFKFYPNPLIEVNDLI